MIFIRHLSLFILLIPCCIPAASAQSDPVENPQRPAVRATQASCGEAPREDALVSLCVPPSSSEEDAARPASEFVARISLNLPNGTPLRIGKSEVYLRDRASARLDRFPILVKAIELAFPNLPFDVDFPKPGAGQQRRELK